MARNGASSAGRMANRKGDAGERALKALAVLKELYPETGTLLVHHDPWQLLVAVQLAAQCTDARVNEVTPEFFRRWPGPADLGKASQEEVEAVIKPCGFYRNKARNLIAAAKLVCEKFECRVPASMEELLTLPGVARKTANCVLFAGFGINEGLAVDTHVRRISYRLGLTANVEPARIEQDLVEIFPRREWGNVNHRLVQFGRDVCKARKPDCLNCPMSEFCPRNQPPRQAAGKNEASDES